MADLDRDRPDDGEPTVGIVIPVHNKQDFVGETVRSALGQQYPAIEIVVVDDGSTDGSTQVVRAAIEGTSARLIVMDNGGVSQARNTGFDALSPAIEFIVFLDADDLLEPEAVSALATHLATHPSALAVYSRATEIDGDGAWNEPSLDSTRWVPGPLGRRRLPDDALVTPLESVFSRFSMLPSGTMIRRAAFERTGRWDPMLCRPARPFHAEDKDMAVQLALLGEVHRLNRRLFRYRILPTAHRTSMYEGLRELDRKWWNADLAKPVRRRVRRAIRFDRRSALLDAFGEWTTAMRGTRSSSRLAATKHLARRLAGWLVVGLQLWVAASADATDT